MLTGKTLRDTARDLAIPGRSTMTADQLRAAIDAVSAPVPSPQVPDVPQVPFRARNGKHKLSTLTRRRPSRHSL